jgi:DNA-binding PadR family transcriptional regulator
MAGDPRMTQQTLRVLQALVRDPSAGHYGLELCEATGLPSGTVYPIVARLERALWLESAWEDPEQHVKEGRPRRRYYILTRDGAAKAHNALAAAVQRETSTGSVPNALSRRLRVAPEAGA